MENKKDIPDDDDDDDDDMSGGWRRIVGWSTVALGVKKTKIVSRFHMLVTSCEHDRMVLGIAQVSVRGNEENGRRLWRACQLK